MLSVVLFAFSLSFDALGYSMGFGSRNIRLKPADFFVLNLLNALILCLFFEVHTIIKLSALFFFLDFYGDYLLLFFGFYYILIALKEQICAKKTCNISQKQGKPAYLNLIDLILLLSIFVVENFFATIIFCANFVGEIYFVVFIFLFHMLFFLLGFFAGNKLAKFFKVDSSLLSGVIFVLLALFNF